MGGRRRLGKTGPETFPIGLGCAAMSPGRGQPRDDAASIATIHAAIEAGVSLIDTADFYGGGDNEALIRRAIEGRRDQVLLSVKFGGLRSPDGAFVGLDCRPAALKNFLTYSLGRLGVDHVDIYRPARLDPQVPIEDTVGAIAELVQAGYVRHIGLSEMGAETVRRAHAVHPICDLQIEYSLMSRGPEGHIFPVLRELGIGVTAYGVLAHGLLGGNAAPAGPGNQRGHLPWFRTGNFERNRALADALAAIAHERGVTSAELAIAWVLAQGEDIVPVVGSRKPAQLASAIRAVDLTLTPEDLARIEAAVPAEAVAGTRYDEQLMKMLDSERSAGG